MINKTTTPSNNYWLVVYSLETGDFKNAIMSAYTDETEEVSTQFEGKHPDYRVIHIGQGETPPKTYRSLQYVS